MVGSTAWHPVGLWFSVLAACGSNFFMEEKKKSKVFKGHSKWQLEEESEASSAPVHRKLT